MRDRRRIHYAGAARLAYELEAHHPVPFEACSMNPPEEADTGGWPAVDHLLATLDPLSPSRIPSGPERKTGHRVARLLGDLARERLRRFLFRDVVLGDVAFEVRHGPRG